MPMIDLPALLANLSEAVSARFSSLENRIDHIPVTIYVDQQSGDDSNSGTYKKPLKTHTAALEKAEAASSPRRVCIFR